MNLEGKKAPEFDLEGSDGKRHRLQDYKGKTVVLYFYPKDNTPGCTKEACGFRDLNKETQNADALVLGVSKDSIKSHEKFRDGYRLNFPLLSDPDTKTMRAYAAWGKKMMYGKEVEGTIRSTVVIGPDGKVRKHWQTVKNAEAHPEEVLDFLRAGA